MYLINWAAKCQSKTLSEQYHSGVRYFDIRLKWDDKKEGWVIAHGLIEYKGNIRRVLETLDSLAKFYNEKLYVRFLLEYNKRPDDEATKILKLSSFVRYVRGKYSNITYHFIETKWDEKVIETYSDNIILIHSYSSILGWKRFFWIPYWYAKFHNKEDRKTFKISLEDKANRVLMLDFV
jgi:hypothetical protein|nr:MAG TPA: hypothetical protein [Crassvirales sp.]